MDVETEKTLFTLSLLPAYGFSEKAQPIGWRRVMVTCRIFGDDVLEERVISLFRRLGQDGRGVTLTSLQTYTGVPGTRLRALLASLVQRGKLAPAGCDPLDSDFAFRLSLSAKKRAIDIDSGVKRKRTSYLKDAVFVWVFIKTRGLRGLL